MVWAAFITFLLLLFRARRYRNLKKISWLLGTWESVPGNGDTIIETWQRLKGPYEGTRHPERNGSGIKSLLLNEKKKKVSLMLTLDKEEATGVFLFEITELSGTSFRCKCDALDFPYKISYTKLNDDEIVIEMEGKSQQYEKISLTRKDKSYGRNSK